MPTKATYTSYASTLDPQLMLYARFAPAAGPAPLLLQMHGWHGNIKAGHTDNITPLWAGDFCLIEPEMRGRGDSGGKPDANGLELQDAVDALAACRQLLPAAVAPAAPPYLWGGSGGGGNVLGLVGKFPDLFAAAVCECGISDYGLWHEHDWVGEFRDELEGAGWIGGSPATNPEAYLSRGGRTTAMNLLTPLLLVHGLDDPRVPYEQAVAYLEACRRHRSGQHLETLFFPGVGKPSHFSGLDAAGEQLRRETIVRHLNGFAAAPELPAVGRLVVAGYIVTRKFTVRLESVDQVALLEYDLARERFELRAPSCRQARLHLSGAKIAKILDCRHLPLPELQRELGYRSNEVE